MKDQFWIPFYQRVWLSDTRLSGCGPSSRGVWMDALANMWNDRPITGLLEDDIEAMARRTRCTPEQFEAAMEEWRCRNVCDISVTDHAIIRICNRRCHREFLGREAANDRQKRKRAKDCHTPVTPESRQISPPIHSYSHIHSQIPKEKTSLPPAPPEAPKDPLDELSLLQESWPTLLEKFEKAFPGTTCLPETDRQTKKWKDTLRLLAKEHTETTVIFVLNWWLTSNSEESDWWRKNGCQSVGQLRKRKDGGPMKFETMKRKWEAEKNPQRQRAATKGQDWGLE